METSPLARSEFIRVRCSRDRNQSSSVCWLRRPLSIASRASVSPISVSAWRRSTRFSMNASRNRPVSACQFSIRGARTSTSRLAARVSSRPANRSRSSPLRALASTSLRPRRSRSAVAAIACSRRLSSPMAASSASRHCSSSSSRMRSSRRSARETATAYTSPARAASRRTQSEKPTCSCASWVMNARIAPRARRARSSSGSEPAL